MALSTHGNSFISYDLISEYKMNYSRCYIWLFTYESHLMQIDPHICIIHFHCNDFSVPLLEMASFLLSYMQHYRVQWFEIYIQ